LEISIRRPLLALAVLTGFVVADEPTRLPLPDTGPPAAATYWYGLYMQGTKVGWARVTDGRTAEGTLVEEWEVEGKFAAMGEKFDFRARERIEFESRPPYAVARATSEVTTGPARLKVSLERAEHGYRAVIAGPGGEQVKTIQELDYTFADTWTNAEWFRQGRRAGDNLTVRSLDLEEIRTDADTYHVDEVSEAILHGIAVRCYRGRAVSSSAGEVGSYTATSTGDFVQLTFAEIFEARLEDETTAKQITRSQDLFVMGTVPIDRPLGDPEGVAGLVLEATGEGAAKLTSGPRQSIEEPDGRRVLRVGATHGIVQTATEDEIHEALASTTEFPAGDERIVALAREAVGDAKTDEEKLRRLLKFVSGYVEDAISGADAFSALDVVAARRGDCTEHAALFTAVARAAGIPARPVWGFMYMGDGVKAFGGHAWNEVVLEGKWVAVDPTWNQMEIDATHIAIGHGDRGQVTYASALGRLKFRLVSVDRKP
jgi:hypothetical protein